MPLEFTCAEDEQDDLLDYFLETSKLFAPSCIGSIRRAASDRYNQDTHMRFECHYR